MTTGKQGVRLLRLFGNDIPVVRANRLRYCHLTFTTSCQACCSHTKQTRRCACEPGCCSKTPGYLPFDLAVVFWPFQAGRKEQESNLQHTNYEFVALTSWAIFQSRRKGIEPSTYWNNQLLYHLSYLHRGVEMPLNFDTQFAISASLRRTGLHSWRNRTR